MSPSRPVLTPHTTGVVVLRPEGVTQKWALSSPSKAMCVYQGEEKVPFFTVPLFQWNREYDKASFRALQKPYYPPPHF